MPQSTRRIFCRMVFLLFCGMPTLLLGGWILAAHSPSLATPSQAVWQQELTRHLGLQVSIDEVTREPNGNWSLQRVRLVEPETGALLATARRIEVARSDATWKLLVSQAEIREGGLLPLWAHLHQRLLCDRDESAPSVSLSARDVTLESGGSARTLRSLQVLLETSPSGPQATLDFNIAGLEMTQPAQLRILRNRQLDPPATGWVLHTRTTPLPCSLLSAYASVFENLGSDCHFAGSIWATRAASGWQGEIAGDFHDMDLQQLVRPLTATKLAGRAHARLSIARFENGQLLEAAGELSCAEGVIGDDLLDRLATHLHLQRNPELPSDPRRRWAFRDLHAGFRLDADGLLLGAATEATTPGALLDDVQGNWLLSAAQHHGAPAVGLARALVPDNLIQVPATRQTRALLSFLPLPNIELPPDAPLPPPAIQLQRE